jgi:hypothetical protein
MPKVIINSAHTEGPTALAFSKDGLYVSHPLVIFVLQSNISNRHAYTGGSDGLVRIWQTDQGGYQEPEVAAEADKGITSLSATVRDSMFPSLLSTHTPPPEHLLALWERRRRSQAVRAE